MFDPQDTPRVFATPIGVDFSRAVVAGIAERMAGAPPEALARVEVYVNTARTQRRLREIYAQSGPGFLPRIRCWTGSPSLRRARRSMVCPTRWPT